MSLPGSPVVPWTPSRGIIGVAGTPGSWKRGDPWPVAWDNLGSRKIIGDWDWGRYARIGIRVKRGFAYEIDELATQSEAKWDQFVASQPEGAVEGIDYMTRPQFLFGFETGAPSTGMEVPPPRHYP